MASKSSALSSSSASRKRPGQQQPSTYRVVVDTITAPENRNVLTALGVFAAGVAFLHSGMGEILLPPTV